MADKPHETEWFKQDLITMPLAELRFDGTDDRQINRAIAVETPISVEICGIAYAVMMATPADLEDYAVGFALAEGLAANPGEIEDIGVHAIGGGIALRIWLPDAAKERVFERVREQVR